MKDIFKYKSVGRFPLQQRNYSGIISFLFIFAIILITSSFAYQLIYESKENFYTVFLVALIFILCLSLIVLKVVSVYPNNEVLPGTEIFENGELVKGRLMKRDFSNIRKPYLISRYAGMFLAKTKSDKNFSSGFSVFEVMKANTVEIIKVSDDTSECVIGKQYDFIYFENNYYLLIECL